MIKALFQQWFPKRVVQTQPQLSIFTTLQETNKALDGLIEARRRMFEADQLVAQLNQMAAFSKTEEFQVMAQNKADLVAFLDEADELLTKMKNL